MPDHLHLPDPRHVPSRRLTSGASERRPAPRAAHGAQLAADLANAARMAAEAEEIDTEFIVKFRGDNRLKPPYKAWNLTPLGEGAGWTYYVLISAEARSFLRDLFNDYSQSPDDGSEWQHAQAWAEFVRDLTGIEFYGPQDRAHASLAELSFDSLELLDVSIWPSLTPREAERRLTVLRTLTEEGRERNQSIRVIAFDSRPTTTMMRIRADQVLLDRLLHTSVVEVVKPPPTPRIVFPQLREELQLTQSQPEGAYVGVMDDGVVTANRYLTEVVIDSTPFPEGYVFVEPGDHGTAVCGLAAYGDFEGAITDGTSLSVPLPIIHARVLEPYGDNRTRFATTALHHQIVRDAIQWLVERHGVRVILAAITNDYAFTGPLVDEWTQTIDQLAQELDVVIVVPTGNRPKPFGPELDCGCCHVVDSYPRYLEHDDSRLASPANAALAVTVGSIASYGTESSTRPEQVAIAPAGGPSPFTRVGPGHGRTKDGARKPEFVANGGNWVYDREIRNVGDRDLSAGVISTIPPTDGRQLGAFTGTSFAAPRVAHAIASIATRYPDASANMLRALAAIGASRSLVLGIEFNDLLELDLGVYGSIDLSRSTNSGGARVVLMHEGIIPTDSTMIHPVPVPRQFLRGYSSRVIRVSLAFDPPVRRERREYIAGSMSFDLACGYSVDELVERYKRQPTQAQALNPDVSRLGLPDNRLSLLPNKARLLDNTLICRTYRKSTGWDEDIQDYSVVVTHQRSPWTEAQKKRYTEQRYALAIELSDEARADLDLYNLVRSQLQARIRVRS